MDAARKEHVLLVDDEKHLLVSLRDYLTFEGFAVTTAQSGEEALQVIESLVPDLIVLDISMPGMGGMGFLKRISSVSGKPRYPVLVLTARSMLADFFQEVAVDGFVAKPCDEAELTVMIRAILAKHRSVSVKETRVRHTILLAENEVTEAARLVDAMTQAGYDVQQVGSGPELLEKAAALKPDVIVMKEILPLLNGDAVAALLEVMPSTRAIPVVLYDDCIVGKDLENRIYTMKNVRKFLHTSDPKSLLVALAESLAE